MKVGSCVKLWNCKNVSFLAFLATDIASKVTLKIFVLKPCKQDDNITKVLGQQIALELRQTVM